LNAVSLFAGAGIGESRLSELGINVIGANELLPDRAELYRDLHPDSRMVVGDIRSPEIFKELLRVSPSKLDLLMATPPCQGVSVAGKNRLSEQQLHDMRNHLIFPLIQYIRETNPNNILIENVPQYAKLLLPHQGQLKTTIDILLTELGKQYSISFKVLNCAELGVPQNRKRLFVKMSKPVRTWNWPESNRHIVTLKEAIYHLPSLESGEDSGLPWHFARNHSSSHIKWMRHTPTGRSAFDNTVHFPQRADGTPIKAYKTTYHRMHWEQAAPAITMRNDAISSQMNVHPGRKLKTGTYSDARVLTPLELLIVNSMIEKDWRSVKAEENLVRKVIGEGVPPLAMNRIIQSLVGG